MSSVPEARVDSPCPQAAVSAALERDDAGSEPLARRYRAVRGATRLLAAPLSPEDCTVQSMPDASPIKWHLAHTTWFFETFVLERAIAGYRSFHPQYRVLFNSYYNAVGAQHPRPLRGLLTRPTLEDVRRYRERVDEEMLAWLERAPDPTLEAVTELGLHHEQQHQELILTDVKHLFGCNPLRPVYAGVGPAAEAAGAATPLRWHRIEGGLRRVGHGGEGFAFDNEGPRHRVFVEAYELASRPVTNREFLEFMDDGGYERAGLWLSDGWDAVRREDWRAPLYWERDGDAWRVMTLSGMRPLELEEPVVHVSLYEADAFARWAGARLPSEVEWEVAAAQVAVDGCFVESGRLHPAAAPPNGDSPVQLFGDVWEWTRSPYGPYPGYRPPAGALGEYNGKFMCNQFVLRGGSCATPRAHVRVTYRNFFPPAARWQFTGLRLARDAA